MSQQQSPTVAHDRARQQFWLEPEPGQRAVLDYRLQDGRAVFTHTGVPTSLQGRGVAAQLVEAGFEWARAQGLRVVPACSYVEAYLARKPEWADLKAD